MILWDANNGFKDITPKGAEKPLLPSELNVSDLNRMFKQIEDYPDDAIFVIKDTKYYVNDRIDPKELAKLVRKLKELKLRLKNTKKNCSFIRWMF